MPVKLFCCSCERWVAYNPCERCYPRGIDTRAERRNRKRHELQERLRLISQFKKDLEAESLEAELL